MFHSPPERQGKQIHWRARHQRSLRAWGAKNNEGEPSITLEKRSIIKCTGTENFSPARGVKLRGFALDESASFWTWDWLKYEALTSPLTASEALALFIATSTGFNPFSVLSQQGQEENQDDTSCRVTSYTNPYIWKEELGERLCNQRLLEFNRRTWRPPFDARKHR